MDRELVAARATLARFLAAYRPAAATPVPVEDIAESLLGLRVVEVRGLGASGMLRADRREVLIDADECASVPLRRRFTLAHEIGHWVLHAPGGPGAVWCRLAEAVRDPREREANRFAAELLMPEALVRGLAAEHGAERVALAGLLAVSEDAMGWRLYNLGLSPDRPDGAPNSASTSAATASGSG